MRRGVSAGGKLFSCFKRGWVTKQVVRVFGVKKNPKFLRTVHAALLDKQNTTSRQYTLGPDGKRIYTLKKVVDGKVSKSAHPARFSPDDKYSRHRVTLKKRYNLLLTQQPGIVISPSHSARQLLTSVTEN
ncbi:unnamed protein product [Penicillium manginii]